MEKDTSFMFSEVFAIIFVLLLLQEYIHAFHINYSRMNLNYFDVFF